MCCVSDLAERWLDLRHGIPGTSAANTAAAQRRDLVRWGEAFREVSGIAVDDALHWLDLSAAWQGITTTELTVDNTRHALRAVSASYSPATVTRMASTLRGFCGWLCETGQLTHDPTRAAAFRVPSAGEAGEPHALSPEQVAAMLAAASDLPERGVRSTWPIRDVALVETLARTGVRVSELCGLRVSDVELGDRRLLHVRRGTKSRRRREIPLADSTATALAGWISEAAAVRGDHGGAPLFCDRGGAPLTRFQVDRLLRRLAARAGITSQLPPDAMAHAFRHHFGVQLALRGVPLPVIQLLMGHRDPRTTSIYTRLAADELTSALDDAGWLTNEVPRHPPVDL